MELRRRAVLAGVAVGLAGCTTAEELPSTEELREGVLGPDGHPLSGENSVAVVDRTTGGHDLETIATEALDFWVEHAPRYAGFEFDHRRAADDETPDVEIVFVDDRDQLEGCRDYHSAEVLGCAPIVAEGQRIRRPVTAEVVSTGRPVGEVRLTAKHELGHLLGLDHDDEPAYVMSNRIEDRLPEYEHRLTVVDAFEDAWETRNEGVRQFNDGIARWNDREYDRAVERFERSEETTLGIHEHVATGEAAATAFEDMNRPDTVDRDALAEHFETMGTVADLSAEAAAAMADASRAADRGDFVTSRRRHRDANDALEELAEHSMPSPTDAALALGLVREPDEPDPPDERNAEE